MNEMKDLRSGSRGSGQQASTSAPATRLITPYISRLAELHQ
ncbi:hypothetical protein RSAG8_04969, partial [Rhizoctonia solani AG-8 WAC10335]